MNKKSIGLITILTVILVFGCGKKIRTPSDVTDTVAWLDARSALPVFPFGTNPIYMFFNADWCKYCNAMKSEIFSRPEIINYMNHHITSISVMPESLATVKFMGKDYTGEKLMEEFQVTKYPTHFFFNMAGELKGVRVGYIDLREFKLLLRYIAEGDVEKMDFDTFLASPKGEIDTVWGEF
jgi:thioredoxin-related protein